jgi:ABC-type bacteriocin/lantibiotic exporter with double-glycine peptidase domain
MKKIISLVLTLLIAASVSVTAFAGENMKQQKSASCKATAVAEMISRATGRDYRESDFYANASTGSCVNINGRKYGSFTAEYKTDYSGTTKSQQLAKINDSLSRNVPIVVQVSPGNPHHWVTILSKSGSSYLIVDPATGKQIVLSSKYTLGAHGDYGYVCLNGASLSGSNNNGGSTNSSGYYPKYTGSSSSIVTALGAVGVDSSYSNRAKIAAANGISNYSGTAAQNTQMLNLLKNGRLKKY